MTVKELSQLFWLKKEIEQLERRLENLKASARSVSAIDFSAVRVQGGKTESTLENQVLEIMELEQIILEKRKKCLSEQIKLERYIETIPESYLRLIFVKRFIECRKWSQIALDLGGTTEDAVKKACYRYIRSTKKPP